MLIVAIIAIAASHVGNAQNDNGQKLYSSPEKGYLPDPNLPGDNYMGNGNVIWGYAPSQASTSIPIVSIIAKNNLGMEHVRYRGWSKKADGSISSYFENERYTADGGHGVQFAEFNSKTQSIIEVKELPADRVNDERGFHLGFRVDPKIYKSLKPIAMKAQVPVNQALEVYKKEETERNKTYEGSLKQLPVTEGLFTLKIKGENTEHKVAWTLPAKGTPEYEYDKQGTFGKASEYDFVEKLMDGTFILYTVILPAVETFGDALANGKSIDKSTIKKSRPVTKEELQGLYPDYIYNGLQ